MARQFFLTLLLAALCVGGARATCVQAHVFVTGETLTAAVLNANPAAEIACINSITGSTTIYASQIIPTSTAQATFGGSVGYAFPSYIDVGGRNAANLVAGDGGFSRSTTAGAIRLGGGSSSGTLDYGAVHVGEFTFSGKMRTATAQACGTLAGYHVECGVVTTPLTCGANASCTVSTFTFSTNYASAPTCTVSQANQGTTASAYIPMIVPTVSGGTIYAFAVNTFTGTTVSAAYICVGV